MYNEFTLDRITVLEPKEIFVLFVLLLFKVLVGSGDYFS